MMTYEAMEAEIAAVPKFDADPGQSDLKEYLNIMNHPEDSLRVIHVAGTNGKGSVCAYLESILREAGYRTGLFTSPHLIRMNERFRINFTPISDETLIYAWIAVKSALEEGKEKGLNPLTWFEIIFLMGMWIFSRSDIDYCIVETGLGGRFDATATLHPVICVITSISLDHMSVLGDSIEKIAFEKAGIMKKGVPVVALDEKNGAFPVLLAESRRNDVHIEKVSSDSVTILKKRKNKIDFSINNSYYREEVLSISACADYQVYNAALAVTALKVILPDLPKQVVNCGLMHMRWAGRMEEILPGVFLDGAHNPGAVAQVCQQLMQEETRTEFSDVESMDTDSIDAGRWTLLFAVCSDKDYTDMIRMLSRIPWKRIYVTRTEGSRGASATLVAECFRSFSEAEIICIEQAEEAFLKALHDKDDHERLLCIGSLYLVGEILNLKNIRLLS